MALSLEALAEKYRWQALNEGNNGYVIYLLPADTPLMPTRCVVCGATGGNGLLTAMAESEKKNNYQKVSYFGIVEMAEYLSQCSALPVPINFNGRRHLLHRPTSYCLKIDRQPT
jgi:hypothetical protein